MSTFVAALAVVVAGMAVAPAPRRAVDVRSSPAATSPAGGRPRWARVRAGPAATALGRMRRRRRDITPEAVAAWCEALARQVRSGASLRHAVESSEPDDEALRRAIGPLRRRLARGDAVATVVDHTGAGAPADAHDPHLRLALDMLGVVARLGGSPAHALDRTAAALRQRAADRAERRTQAAQARMSAHVLTVVPLAMLSLLALTDASVRTAIATPAGVACLAGGLVLNTLGWLWMRAVIGQVR